MSRSAPHIRHIALALLISAVFLAGAYYLWSLIFYLQGSCQWNRYYLCTLDSELAKTLPTAALTTAGGLGAAVYAVTLYKGLRLDYSRHEHQIEERRETYLIKCNQALGALARDITADNVPAAVAGINGISALAQQFANPRSRDHFGHNDADVTTFNQRCVDVLCSAIRAMSSVNAAAAHGAEIIQHHAVTTLVAHTKMDSSAQWRTCDFDLHETTFHCPLKLEGAKFEGKLELWGSIFERSVYAESAHFANVNFNGTQWNGQRNILSKSRIGHIQFEGNCRFLNPLLLDRATFDHGVCFRTQEQPSGPNDYPGRIVFESDVDMTRCKVKGPLRIESVDIQGSLILTSSQIEAVELHACQIGSDLKMSGVECENISLANLSVARHFSLQDLRLPGETTTHGKKYDFIANTIGGDFTADGTPFDCRFNVLDSCVGGVVSPPTLGKILQTCPQGEG